MVNWNVCRRNCGKERSIHNIKIKFVLKDPSELIPTRKINEICQEVEIELSEWSNEIYNIIMLIVMVQCHGFKSIVIWFNIYKLNEL